MHIINYLAPVRPESRVWRVLCNGLVQYAAATMAATAVLIVFFPGNRFLPVPWQHDDYYFLAAPNHFHNGFGVDFLHTRPVSTNVLWLVGMLGESHCYIAMLLAAALIPVLSVHLALRLFGCRPGRWNVIGLAAGVSACTFLFEDSLWFYHYMGLVTNLTSVILGLLSAYSFSIWFDGRRIGFVAGSLLFLASAFAKEDMLLFVPLFAATEWSIRRWHAVNRLPVSRLASVFGAVALTGGLLFTWNRWVVPSPFTGNQSDAYRLSFSMSHMVRQFWNYIAATHLSKMAFVVLIAAGLIGVLRPQRRLAAIAMIPLIVALILPYAVLPRFFAYYSLNWFSLVVSLSVVCIATNCREWYPSRFASTIWLAPVAILVAIFAMSPTSARSRHYLTAWLNVHQEQNQYVLEQLLHHRDELAGADTIAVRGADEFYSPWLLSNGAYLNMKIGHKVHWLFVVKPRSLAAQFVNSGALPPGDVAVVLEKNLLFHACDAVLSFDNNLNMSVQTASQQPPIDVDAQDDLRYFSPSNRLPLRREANAQEAVSRENAKLR